MGVLRESKIFPPFTRAFLNFFTLTLRAHQHTLSRQPNNIMSEIVCAQLHNELLGCRHNTLQSHGLFALAKHLYFYVKQFCV